jgi:hypothetical protein
MTCIAINFEDHVVLVSRTPTDSVFTTTDEHLKRLVKGSDGHYKREDLEGLAGEGHAVKYDQKAVRAISYAIPTFIHGCDPHPWW